MARIPDEVIERLKQEVSLERLAEARGVKLARHGADLIGLCPFHDDHEPSLVISPRKNLWHCLGACNAGGTVIDWVMRAEGVSFRHAVELLNTLGSSVQLVRHQQPVVKRTTVRKLPPPIDRDADERSFCSRSWASTTRRLRQSPDALAYLEKRGLKSGDDRPLSARFRQPDAGLPAAGNRTARPETKCAGACRSWASCANRATSTSTGRW